jgi:hypothetical protein
MKNLGLILTLAALPLSCGSPTSPSSTPSSSTSKTIDANVLSQDEADAHAASSINEKNADAELEKLKREINGGG